MSGHNFDHLFNKYALDDASENKHKKRSSPFSSFNQRASDASSSQKTDSTGSGSTLCETGQKVDYFNLKTKYSTGRLVSAQHVGLSMYEAHCEPKSNSNSTNKEPTDNDHHNSFDKHKSSVHNRSSFAETRETKSTSHQSLPIDKVSQFISRLNTKPASIERFSTSNNFHRASNKDHSSASYSQREPSVNVSSFSTNVSEGKSSSSHSTAIIKVNQFIARLNSKPISFGYLPSHNSSKKVSDETSSTSHLSSRVLIKNSPSAHSAFHRDLLPSQLTEKQRNPTNQNYVSPNNIEVCSTNIDPDLESLIASTISTSVPETPIHKRSLGLPSLRNLPTTKSTEETSSQPKKPKLEILPNFFAPDAFARPYSSTSRPAFQEHRPSPISQSLPAVSVNQVESLKKPPNCKNVLSKDKKVPNVSKQTKISDFFPTVKHTEGQHTNAGRSCESTKHSNIVTLPFSDVQHSFQSNCQDVVESNHLNYDEVIEAKPFDQLSQEFSQMNFVPDAPIQIRPDHHKPVNVEMLIDRPDFEVDESLRFAYQKLRQARQQLEQRFFWDETAFNKGEQVPADRQELCGILKKPTISKYFKKRLIQKYWNSFPDLNEVCLDPEPMEVIDLEINGSSQSLTPVSQPTQDSMFCNLPSEFRSLFKDFAGFNNLQKMIFDDLIKSNVSLAISAPTGCGKTVAFELAIIKQIMEKCSEKPSVVMISPLKAICKEKFNLWSSKFLPFHYKCIELTGDSEYEDMKAFLNINIIVTTPEKWDSLCRKSSFMKVLNNIELVLIDEIHTINDETRGPVLESLVSRMKLLRSSSNSSKQLRFVTLSATIPNVQDVCEWISYRENDGKYFQIGDETRPVKLKTIVIGYDCPASANDFQFDLELNRQLHKVIEQYSQRRPTLIFASTRKITEKTAEHLSSKHNYAYSLEMRNEFRQIELQLKDAKLRETLKCGVGFHHAGLDCKDRERIQEAFTEGKIPVLISTSTLALGVNLPAHLVIIKGTFQYVNGVCQQYDENQILQMIGRAGRPQFDTEATAVIMTKKALQTKFECYINSSKIVESQLHRCFAENLNTEIYLGLIRNVESAFSWAQSTFLYVRLFKNPQHYGYMDNWSHTRLVNHLKMSILFEIETLIKYDLIKKNEDDEIVSTQIGRIMAENYVCLATMKRFFEIESGATISLLLQLICDCNELLQDTQIRNADKLTLNKLNVVDRKANLFGLRYPIRKPLNTAQKKVNCLIQSFLGCNSLNETPLLSEATKIMKTAGRISKCLMEYLLVVPKGYATLLNAILLSKSISAGIWENSEYVSKQLPRIGITLSTKLVNSNYRTFDSILNANSRDLELLLNKNPPFADKLKENIEDLPKYELNIRQKPINAGILNAALIIQVKLIRDQRSQRFPFHASIILLANEDDRVLLVERIPDSYLLSSKTGATFELTVEKVKKGTVFVHLISERIVGIDRTIQFDPQYQGQRRRLAPVDPDDLSYLEMQFGQ